MPAFREHDRRRPPVGACPGCADVPTCGRPVPLDPAGQPTRCARCAPPVRPVARHWTDRPAHRGADPASLAGSATRRRDTVGLLARLLGEEAT